jgi:hypothetical protein
MKGACQAKTSPTLAIKSFSSTASPQLTLQPRSAASASDRLANTHQERSGLFFVWRDGHSLVKSRPVFYLRLRLSQAFAYSFLWSSEVA